MTRAARAALPAATGTAPSPVEATPATRLIRKVLVANRGEIACRVMRTCRALGIATVAVFSDADADARHVREADEAVRVGPAVAAASYLNIPALIAAAQRSGADAVHPGYGFLAENAAFATACQEVGLTFIGPEPRVIARMGSKRAAKREMAAAGIPVLPGYDGEDQSVAAMRAAAARTGYPLLVKASAGGGGKGMRIVTAPDALPDALAAAQREAAAAFGDDTLLIEKLLIEPRHIEVQIAGDSQGNVLHLGERECSIQRRHQKVIEETPSPALTPALRARMTAAAVTIGQRLGYTGVGTVEFLVDRDGSFYFLEVNTRLQVEHPITELVTGLDLVRWQVLVAEGHPLPLTQDTVRFAGHAVEARVYAEDPARGFLPASGPIALWRQPDGDGVRVDAGIASGDAVSPYYDPLLAKISAHAGTRAEALRRLEHALATTTLLGVRNNLDFLRRTLLHPDHLAGVLSTAFIERHAADLLVAPRLTPDHGREGGPVLAALVAGLRCLFAAPALPGPAARWRNNPNRPALERFVVHTDGELGGTASDAIELRLEPRGASHYAATVAVEGGDETTHALRVASWMGPDLTFELDGHLLRAVAVESAPDIWWVRVGDTTHALRRVPALTRPALAAIKADAPPRDALAGAGSSGRAALGEGVVVAPMPGLVVAVVVADGQVVAAGDPLVVLEAMKMEHTVRASRAGRVSGIRIAHGEQVNAGAALLRLTSDGPA
ncbi:MAG: acetyl/propionyl/methylcrotonyl-CoA carboxylase subunit alpha [Ktedonobacterales bacterium]